MSRFYVKPMYLMYLRRNLEGSFEKAAAKDGSETIWGVASVFWCRYFKTVTAFDSICFPPLVELNTRI